MKIVVGMATTNARADFCKLAVLSLVNQVDEIHVYNNDNEEHDYTDNAKFYFLQFYKEPIYYFSCDDDILYPPNYVQDMLNGIGRNGGIVTHHGRQLLGKDRNYYRGHKGYRCLDDNSYEGIIDVAGTGVTAFRTDYFNPVDLYKSNDKRMSDLIFSLEAARNQKEITILPHKRGWLKDLRVPAPLQINVMERRNTRQTEVANLICDVKGIS